MVLPPPPAASSSSSSSSSPDDPSPPFNESVSTVRFAISAWDPRTSLRPSFLRATSLLHSHLLRLSSDSHSPSNQAELVKIHSLLVSAMSCLQQSLKHHLLSISAAHLLSHDTTIATLSSTAHTMLSAGYGNECLSTYQSVRRSTFHSQLQLHFDYAALNRPKAIRKFEWRVLESHIKSWTNVAPLVVRSLCSDEQRLSDHIFALSPDSVRHSIFSTIVSDTALQFLSFPQTVALHFKASPEKLFRLLDMYAALSNLLPDIESMFQSEPASTVRLQALSSLRQLSEAIRVVVSQFELAIQNDPLNSSGILGGAIHPLTRYVMNYVAYLSDFNLYLHEILIDLPTKCTSLFLEQCNLKDESVASVTVAWIIFVLLCKIDAKAGTYSDAALSYLFLANNIQYIITKVESCCLKESLGEEWVREHSMKARRFLENHVRSGWAQVLRRENRGEDVNRSQEFDMALVKAIQERKDWLIADPKMREEARQLVQTLLLPTYSEWYQNREDFVAAALLPADVKRRIMKLYGDPAPDRTSTSATSSN